MRSILILVTLLEAAAITSALPEHATTIRAKVATSRVARTSAPSAETHRATRPNGRKKQSVLRSVCPPCIECPPLPECPPCEECP
ncbi:MAG: hypothetical protein RMJ43_10120 [Chloroherpetonaceae bacterium]|nr:hypothetical protein [Chthonomonadaceae bacterium]MDW8208183.1 hypothetical protein [Chloroherpetonaceae bacterium]